jgi:hypothetical protein
MAAALCLPGPARAQAGAAEPGALRAGRFDFGKMWTFEYAPADYFSEAYGFDAQPAWFERARLSVLRIPGCSASFVSPNGLVATNHHCVRGAVTRVARQGERLLDDGFYAQALAEERRIPDYYADQLIAIADVSDEVFRATDRAGSEAERNQAREAALEAIRARLVTQHAVPGDSVWVQLVPLYHGGRYSAYVFRRFGDVRLVAAPELQLGFFGGDSDNFTYPRHDLDFAFLRIYDREGRPYQPQHYFGWSDEGVEPGDVVFVIGNPGATNRLRTIAQLEFQRDVLVPARIRYLESRWAILDAYRRAEPERAEALDVRNRMFGLSNSLKATRGRLVALQDAGIMARKQDAERQLESAIGADRALRQAYGKLFDRIARIQREKAKLAAEYGAFQELGGSMESAILRRALAAYSYLEGRERGMPADSLQALQGRLLRVGDNPAALEQALLAGRLADLERYLGASHSITRAALQGRAPDAAAAALRQASALADSGRTGAAIAAGTLSGEDTAVRLAAALIPAYRAYQASLDQHTQEERALESDLGRARFEVYGRDVPPDGTFSPRITDGVVQGYEYNGTLAPPYTTFYGLYNLYSAHGPGTEWELPARWLTPPAALDLATPLNFVSTADTYGGNSGSPAVTPELELVGLNFDRNIEGLSRDFIYLPERGRNVMVDVRAIRAALDHVYDADRIVLELETGELYETEAAADAVGSR